MSSEKNVSTRSRILKAAWELLENNKGQGARMTDIAKRAGISRQALYLHFKTRADLLMATARYLDEVKAVEERLKPSRNAKNGRERLDAFIDFWGNYIPEIYCVATAFLAVSGTDADAAKAWDDRMQAVRDGCNSAVVALEKDGVLSPSFDINQAVDILWTLLSVQNWEMFTIQCGWSQDTYLKNIKLQARAILVSMPKV